jgi:parvulin-like peptidyl-prolyl isomerase
MIIRSLSAIALLILISPLAACDFLDNPGERVAIHIGDEEITVARLQEDLLRLAGDLELSEDEIKAYLHPMLEQLVERYLILVHGKETGVRLDQGELTEAVEEIKEDYGSDKQFEEALLESYVDFEDWRKRLRDQLLIKKIIKKNFEKIPPISSERIQDYYEKHLDEFKHPELVLFTQIIAHEKDLIESILAKNKDGKQLENLGKELSGSQSGVVYTPPSWAARKELGEELGDEVFSLEPGGSPRIIHTEHGYHLVKVLDKRPAGVRKLPDVVDEIERRLLAERQEAFFDQWIGELRDRYPVRLNKDAIENLEIGLR